MFKEKYQHYVQDEIYFKKGTQYAPVLSKYPKVEEQMISIFKKQRTIRQPLYGATTLWNNHLALDKSHYKEEGASFI
jgi:hypothetical protein